MASRSSDAERLLNTIVAARVRLTSLRGGPESHPEVTYRETEAAKPSPAPLLRPDQVPEQARTTHDHDPAAWDTSNDSSFDQGDRDLLAFEQGDAQPMVLGIDPEEPATPFSETPPEREEPATIDDGPDLSTESAEDLEIDPFSFIDLIPPEDTGPSDVDSAADPRPSVEPPPIRPKPTMPLPVGSAAGAPAAKPAELTDEPKPADETKPAELKIRPSPAQRVVTPTPVEPRPSTSPAPLAEPSTPLSQPKQVAPRVLDPNRSGLEVDVFENEMLDAPAIAPAMNAPRLTEARPIRSEHTQPREAHRSEDDLFDRVTEGMAQLGKGNVRAAHQLFSDVLDWVPSHLEARLARGRCSRDLGDTIAAYSDFQRALLQAPQSPSPYIELGDLFFAKKNYIRAISHYDEALSIAPRSAITLCRRGISHHHRKRTEQATADLLMA